MSPEVASAGTEELKLARRPKGLKVQFPKDDKLRDDRFGLFVGIDKYPRLPEGDLDGCVYDALSLKEIFAKRFGFERWAMLTNAQASRAGIHSQFTALVKQIERVRARSKKLITVVITYAGHGRQVIDDDDSEEADSCDETWIAADSGPKAKNDIRDDELHVFYRQLAKLNCQTIIISDSCHSGTLHRGPHKMRRYYQEKPPQGPSDKLFDNFGLATRGARGKETEPLPGFVFYGACHEGLQAYECRDKQDKACGRFTLALRQVLPKAGPQSSYQELFEQLVLAFEKNWPGDPSQAPHFHADPRKQGEVFLYGGRPEPHASIIPKSIKGRRLELTMGSVDGVVDGAEFVFFGSLDHLKKRKSPLAVGRVIAITPFACKVELKKAVKLRESVKARLDMVRLVDFAVYAGKGTPKQVIDEIKKLDKNQQLRLVSDKSQGYSVAVCPVPGKPDQLGVYRPNAEPGIADTRAVTAEPLVALSLKDAAAGLGDHLLYLARVQRLMSLEYGEDRLKVELVPKKRNRDNKLEAIQRGRVTGIQRLKDADLFTLKISNQSGSPMHVTVFYLDADGNLSIIYPKEEGDVDVVKPGKTLQIAEHNPFSADVENEQEVRARGFERMRMKVVASSVRMDFTPLTIRPRSGSRGMRKRSGFADAPLFNLMGDVLLGGSSTRAPNRTRIPTSWATATLVVDVEPKDKSKEP